jgi:transporter family-2 protein
MAIWYALGLVAGMAQAVQGAINAQLRTALQSPLWAALISFIVGTLGLAALVLAVRAPVPSQWPTRAWVWSGGLLGVFYVGSAILLIPRIGAATMIGLFVAGQMCAALALDHFGWIGLPEHTATLPRLFGATLIVAGVFVLRRF